MDGLISLFECVRRNLHLDCFLQRIVVQPIDLLPDDRREIGIAGHARSGVEIDRDVPRVLIAEQRDGGHCA